MQADKIFYSLFQAFPSIFFAIIGDTTVNVNAYEFVSVELKETAFRIECRASGGGSRFNSGASTANSAESV
ncbi:MAG: DUF2887 domain-containing protein [Nostoc sp. ChiQUE02]|uniref:DUF2887 domain-containing protein n=1 Tax=Nostoc sp. ChiQUE02 TaxID=3075377 RepID=UPI002AD20890|nr:DUF2887 domain-containing protein [Nostoc sp. ChiQUE02]MDZ8231711.1 DUF2887 domain-containing protein [Nostoc sp. ChiQUE02]